MRELRLTHPDLDFWVDVRLREWIGRWLAVADLADEPDVGTGDDPQTAIRGALAALGEPYASEMAAELATDRRLVHGAGSAPRSESVEGRPRLCSPRRVEARESGDTRTSPPPARLQAMFAQARRPSGQSQD